MAKHGPGVTETKVHVVVAVGIRHMRPLGTRHLQRKRCVPVTHPVQRNTKQPVLRGLLRKGLGFGVGCDEASLLLLSQGLVGE